MCTTRGHRERGDGGECIDLRTSEIHRMYICLLSGKGVSGGGDRGDDDDDDHNDDDDDYDDVMVVVVMTVVVGGE